MPTNIRVIHPQDCIRATPDGLLDHAMSMKLLDRIVEAGQTLGDYRLLLDTRQARAKLSAVDLWYLAERLATAGAAFRHRTAVLCPVGERTNAEFFATCAANRGLGIAAFTSFEDAIEWLIAGWADA